MAGLMQFQDTDIRVEMTATFLFPQIESRAFSKFRLEMSIRT